MSDTLDLNSPAQATPSTPSTASGTQDNQFVTFNVAGEMFAVPMAPVQEIIRVPDVARLPLAPPALDGLANLRGRVLPIVNLRSLFNTEACANDDSTRALVINLGQPLGFVVDRVSSVISVNAGELEPASQVQSIVRSDYLSGVINRTGPEGQRQLMLVLDFDKLIHEQFATVQRAAQRSETTSGTQAGAEGADNAAATVDELRLVSFTVAQQEYAIDIADVREIVQVPSQITAVPNAPRHVLGLISLRSRLLPLVSLRSLFHLPTLDLDEHHRIVVVAVPGGGQVGLVTDAVKEVLSVPRTQADAMPGVLSRDPAMQEFESICRLDGGRRLVSIIATDRLLGLSAMRQALGVAASFEDGSASSITEDTDMSRVSRANEASTDDDLQAVIFRLGAEEFGVPIMSVQEIVRVPEVLTRMPKTPPFVVGVINLRGTVLPVIDQRTRLGLPAIERNDRQRIMVYTLNGVRTGFIVDSVAEVLRIGRQHVEPAPELSDEQGRLITRVAKLEGDKRLVMLIDPTQLLGAQEARAIGEHEGFSMPQAAGEAQALAKAA